MEEAWDALVNQNTVSGTSVRNITQTSNSLSLGLVLVHALNFAAITIVTEAVLSPGDGLKAISLETIMLTPNSSILF